MPWLAACSAASTQKPQAMLADPVSTISTGGESGSACLSISAARAAEATVPLRPLAMWTETMPSTPVPTCR
jgi:hypothetical protein